MSDRVEVTVLVENTAFGRNVVAEHGLSFWIETGQRRILFDTGQTPEILQANADQLGIDLRSADSVVLSHGHDDHTGGLDRILDISDGTHLYVHPGAMDRKFSQAKNGAVTEIGIPRVHEPDTLRERTSGLTWTGHATSLGDGFWVTGTIPRATSYEDTGGAFYLDSGCTLPDPIEDDQAIYFSTELGTVILLGCAHAGLVNTLSLVQSKTGGEPIAAVIGGTHLVSASPERMEATMGAIRELGIGLLAPIHCTGARAQARFATEFPEAWEPTHVGSRFEFLRSKSPRPV